MSFPPFHRALAALIILCPLIWSLGNENTALVKSFAAGICAAVLLVLIQPRRLLTMMLPVAPLAM